MLDVTPRQKYCVSMVPVLTGYWSMDVSCHSFGVCLCVSYTVFKELNELFGFNNIQMPRQSP
jgi:hypothetical protein